MRPLIVLFIFCIVFSLHAQVAKIDSFLLVDATALTLREGPSVSSKKLATASFGAAVKVLDLRAGDSYIDVIDGMYGTWTYVSYKGQKGYMYSEYLHQKILRNLKGSWQGSYLMLKEGYHLSVDYDSTLVWYGIYQKEEGEYIEKVDVKISIGEDVETETRNTKDLLKVYTNLKEKSIMLLGSRFPMKEGRVGYNMREFRTAELMNHHRVVIPRLATNGKINAKPYLSGYGTIPEKNNCHSKDYYLNYFTGVGRHSAAFKDIGGFSKYCNVPKIFWFGDINGDGMPDFIFSVNPTMYSTQYLFYKSKLEDEKLTFKLTSNYIPMTPSC